MHVFTLVITPGTRNTAVRRAFEILAKPKRRQHDYAGIGGRFADRLVQVMDTPSLAATREARAHAIEEWHQRNAERKKARRATRSIPAYPQPRADEASPTGMIPLDPEDVESLIDAIEEMDDLVADPRPPEVIEPVDCVALTSQLPKPLPDELIPPLYVTPDGRWHWRPLEGPRLAAWSGEVNRVIDRHRGGHCIVVMDVHV